MVDDINPALPHTKAYTIIPIVLGPCGHAGFISSTVLAESGDLESGSSTYIFIYTYIYIYIYVCIYIYISIITPRRTPFRIPIRLLTTHLLSPPTLPGFASPDFGFSFRV